jgi:PPM family protein phosphatase
MTVKRLFVASVTHRGHKREGNEDCLVVGSEVTQESVTEVSVRTIEIEQSVLCMVADGMGGHASGEVASRFVSEQFAELAVSLPPDADAVAKGVEAVNLKLSAYMQTDPSYSGMGTTVVGILFFPQTAVCFNVGDSSVFRVEEQFLAKMSIDDVSVFGRKGALTQALGGTDEHDPVEPHTRMEPDHAGHSYLICSDGLTDMVSTAEMAACIGSDPGQTVSKLLHAALASGGLDNISIIFVQSEQENFV